MGQITPDLLYWSAVGSSYWYTVFAGLLEVAAASLLLFRRTFRLGAFIGLIIMANVVAINFGFNISVKLFSTFLLTGCILILWPDLKAVFKLLMGSKAAPGERWVPVFKKTNSVYYFTKFAILAFFMADVLYPYASTGNWNDDLEARPMLHGGFKVEHLPNWKNAFFHRKGYFIVQDSMDVFTDYSLMVDTTKKLLRFSREMEEQYWSYQLLKDGNIVLNDPYSNRMVRLSRLPYRTLPIFRKNFDWHID